MSITFGRIISAVKPVAFEHWDRSLGFANRAKIQVLQTGKHGLRAINLMMLPSSPRMELLALGLEKRIEKLQLSMAQPLGLRSEALEISMLIKTFALIDQPIIVLETSGRGKGDVRIREIMANPAFEHFIGSGRSSIEGKELSEIFTGKLGELHKTLAKMISSNEKTMVNFTSEKSERHFRIMAIPLEEQRHIVIFNDVTEIKNSEKMSMAQTELAIALAGARNVKAAHKIIIELIQKHSLMDSCGMYVFDKQTRSLRLEEHAGFIHPGFIEEVKEYGPDAPNTQMIVAGNPIYLEEKDLADVPSSTAVLKEGIRSIAIIPIKFGGSVIACINMSSHSRVKVPEFAKRFLEDTAVKLGVILERNIFDDTIATSERRFRSLFSNMTQGFCTGTIERDGSERVKDYKILQANEAFLRAAGMESLPEGGLLASEMFGSPRPAEVLEVIGKALKSSEPAIFESTWKNRSLRTHVFSPEKDNFAMIIEDITRAQRLRERERRATLAEELALHIRSVVHGFNNYLTGVIGAQDLATIMLEKLVEELNIDDKKRAGMILKIQEYIVMASASAQKAASTARTTLNNTKIVKLPEDPAPIKSSIQSINKVLAAHRERVEKEIDFSLQIDDNLPNARFDTEGIESALTNLVINAFAATPMGGRVRISVKEETIVSRKTIFYDKIVPGTFIRIDVEDTGTGIPEEVFSRLFTPEMTTKGEKGTGLGLVSVKWVVDAHGGFIDVKTRYGVPDSGTTFSIYLPTEREK